MFRYAILLLILLFHQSAFASIYKCELGNGKVEYQSAPCKNGQNISNKIKSSAVTNNSSSKDTADKNINSPVTAEKKCTGKEMSLYFPNPDTPILTMLHVIADFSGNKLVADLSINGIATFTYTCVPWDNILKDIAAKHNLLIKVENKSILANKK